MQRVPSSPCLNLMTPAVSPFRVIQVGRSGNTCQWCKTCTLRIKQIVEHHLQKQLWAQKNPLLSHRKLSAHDKFTSFFSSQKVHIHGSCLTCLFGRGSMFCQQPFKQISAFFHLCKQCLKWHGLHNIPCMMNLQRSRPVSMLLEDLRHHNCL